MDSFANAPYQDERTKAGEFIPMIDMITENQRQIANTPRGENSFKYKQSDVVTQAAQRARSTGCEEHGGRQISSSATDNLNNLAQSFILDFEKSKVELVPLVKG
jgi:hypothetical protein